MRSVGDGDENAGVVNTGERCGTDQQACCKCASPIDCNATNVQHCRQGKVRDGQNGESDRLCCECALDTSGFCLRCIRQLFLKIGSRELRAAEVNKRKASEAFANAEKELDVALEQYRAESGTQQKKLLQEWLGTLDQDAIDGITKNHAIGYSVPSSTRK